MSSAVMDARNNLANQGVYVYFPLVMLTLTLSDSQWLELPTQQANVRSESSPSVTPWKRVMKQEYVPRPIQ